MKKKDRNPELEFENYYKALYGDRWESLKLALTQTVTYETLDFGGSQTYSLNAASAHCARLLQVSPHDSVLDLCAAPGGKSLILAAGLEGQGRLISNELSAERRRRLKRVIETVLPPQWTQIISIVGGDGSLIGKRFPESFDRILADVPCSSEAHLLSQPQLIQQWSTSRIKSLSMRQLALLASGVDALKTEGEIIYSTCAIAPAENDEVIAKILKKRPQSLEILTLPPLGEATKFGRIILPDTTPGMGPLYICKLKKIRNSLKHSL